MNRLKHISIPSCRGEAKGWRHETLLVTLLGFVIMASLNVMMVQWHPELFTNPKLGAWSAFWLHGEFSGFDTFTYIAISSFRPIYVISRHPLLMMYVLPAYALNDVLKSATGINCAIYIAAVIWTILATCSWVLMYRIMRRLIALPWVHSLILTLFFFSFSHVMIVTFFPDHMSMTLPLILLAIYLAGKALRDDRPMPLWQSLPLALLSTGVTTTNIVKVAIADFFTQWGKKTLPRMALHFSSYLIVAAILTGAYLYQTDTIMQKEAKNVENIERSKSSKDPEYAKKLQEGKKKSEQRRKEQIFDNPLVTNTEYHIDRLPSLVENVFGEGLILHEDYTLKDTNRQTRPALVRYNHWWYYAIECFIVMLFIAGLWCGRHERIVWMTLSMFIFDMLLHVGLNFASADVYIMTAHWAFVIPIAIGYLLRRTHHCGIPTPLTTLILLPLLLLTAFLWWHNLSLIARYILG